MLALIDDPGRSLGVVPVNDGADPRDGIAGEPRHSGDVVAPRDELEHLPVAAFDGVATGAVAVLQLGVAELRGDGEAAGHGRTS